MTKFGDLLKKHREELAKKEQPPEQTEETIESIEDVSQDLPEVSNIPLPKRLVLPKAQPRQPVVDREELSLEDIDLMIQNLAQDEDIVLYLKALRGESKYNMLLKLQGISNPKN